MNIQEIRRENLRAWVSQNGTPPKERSYFSQLLGGASFGERAARRLEKAYGMGHLALDCTNKWNECAEKGKFRTGDEAPAPNYVRLKLLEAIPHMGYGGEPVDSPEVLQYVDVLRDYISVELRSNPDRIDLLPAKGDSMAGTIEDGDIVFVDRTVRRFDGDGIYVIVWSGRLLLKRLHAMIDGRLEVKSDNQRYTPEYITSSGEDELSICGRVVGKWGLQRL